MKTTVIDVHTGRQETVHDLTAECAKFAREASGGGDGLLHVFVPHATAGVAVLELGAGSDDDLLAALADLLAARARFAGTRPVTRAARAGGAVHGAAGSGRETRAGHLAIGRAGGP
jgi:thiamine phosphate synthase YjbQ (UPF0047 family)